MIIAYSREAVLALLAEVSTTSCAYAPAEGDVLIEEAWQISVSLSSGLDQARRLWQRLGEPERGEEIILRTAIQEFRHIWDAHPEFRPDGETFQDALLGWLRYIGLLEQ